MATFYYKSTCTTCRKARTLLRELGADVDERDMSKNPLSAEEVRSLIGDRDLIPFLNPKNEQYREQGMKKNPPSKEEAISLMAANANLIKRPLLVDGDNIVFGANEEVYRERFGG